MEKVVFSVDWLSLTVKTDREHLLPLLAVLGLDKGLEHVGSGIGFEMLEFGQDGFQFYSGGTSKEYGEYCSLRFPGSCLQVVGMEAIQEFYESCLESKWRCKATRLDLAYDTQLFEVEDIRMAVDHGYVECRAKQVREFKDESLDGGVTGHTLYFGSRQSEAMVRVYYKTDGLSFGDEPFTRVELELKDKRSEFSFIELMAWPVTEWAVTAGQWLTSFISVALVGWQKMVESFTACWIVLRRPSTSLERMERWIEKQVAPTLAAVTMARQLADVDAMHKMVMDWIELGVKRLYGKKKQLALVGAGGSKEAIIWASSRLIEF